jgi:hypothetical protein
MLEWLMNNEGKDYERERSCPNVTYLPGGAEEYHENLS